jgi:hypothetical protein
VKTWSELSPRAQKVHGIVLLAVIVSFPVMGIYQGARPATPQEQADYNQRYVAAKTEQLLGEAFARSQVVRVCPDGSLIQKDEQTGRLFWLWKSYWGDRHAAMAADARIDQVCEVKP